MENFPRKVCILIIFEIDWYSMYIARFISIKNAATDTWGKATGGRGQKRQNSSNIPTSRCHLANLSL